MTYRERREAKAERLREWAGKREVRASADLARAREMGSVIPFGQSILVGHHSEGRDRNYRNRIANTYDRAFESAKKAEGMASRADNIESQLDSSIYDDDPDAIAKLREKLGSLEDERERRKSANADYRKAHKTELAAMGAYDRGQAVPYPSYSISNLGGRITQIRQRLERLEAQAARVEAAEAAGGVSIQDLRGGYVTVTFTEKPAREILDALKAAGFRWAKGSWVGIANQLPEEVQS